MSRGLGVLHVSMCTRRAECRQCTRCLVYTRHVTHMFTHTCVCARVFIGVCAWVGVRTESSPVRGQGHGWSVASFMRVLSPQRCPARDPAGRC